MSLIRRSGGRGLGPGRRGAARGAVAVAAALLVTGGMSGGAWAAEKPVPAADDFDGDGYADLVVGAPGATVSGKERAGYVAVTYGSADGADPSRKKLISRSTAGVPGSAAAGQQFGKSFSKGDLDGDGYGDLVIGSADGASGAVILWGSPEGLTGGTAVDGLGNAPQTGDFDGDGKTDLALFGDAEVGGDDPVKQDAHLFKGPVSRAGEPAGLLDFMDKSEWWGYGSDGAACAEDDSCISGPRSVSGPITPKAVGDLNGDSRDDIVTWEYEGDGVWGTHTLMGGTAGFTRGASIGAFGSSGGEAATDVGDVNGDGYDDVVVGSSDDSAQVTVAYGSSSGTSGDRVQEFDQSLPGFYGAQEKGDRVGSCVAVADVTGDGRAEVALGISGEDFSGLTDAGSVALLRGTGKGVSGEGSQVLHQNTPGVPGVAEKGDKFGAACSLLDTDGDGTRDLAVTSAAENSSAGAVWTFRGTSDGVTTKNAAAFGPADLQAPTAKARFGTFVR
ncbi:FG-GAP-like repeat-containing protein [Streptomyces sp. HNM0574]|uniref:FG-GAP-like repeat-containing protein n=1 Tax=Streptomyces sp. HNM0574 TaxID=2714954 RepID=UPI00146C705A|nr:FG-GAP-like repeat-containing protein [Streptomyces sp. HNM0574]NLU70855.1 hypothetical protein [Streptomyces sp. HNM0574]